MTNTLETPQLQEQDAAQVDGFTEKIFGSLVGAFDIAACHIGHELGLYKALADGDATPGRLADRLGLDTRYVREWLEHQTVSGTLECPNPEADAADRIFHIPASRAAVLVDETSLDHMAPFASLFMSLAKNIDELVDVFRTGEGFSWSQHGDGARKGQADANRPMFLEQLGQEYLASVPDIDARLRAGGRVADVGCGYGWSSIGVARAFPDASVIGYDVDGPSIAAARINASRMDVADRVRFEEADVSSADLAGSADLVMALECVHDLADPVGFLGSMRSLAADDGAVVVMDERVGEVFTGEQNPIEAMFYGFSLLCCLPDGRSHAPSAATGTVMRPGTLAEYARQAGFERVEILDIENDFFRFYRLHQR